MRTLKRVHRTIRRQMICVALATASILIIPMVAMLFTSKVNWSVFDFIVMGILLFGTGLTYVLISRLSNRIAYRAAVGIAVLTGFLLIWINLAVGIIGSENNPANQLYIGVLAVGIIGAFIARLRPHGMARTLFATALAQMLVPVIALLIWKPSMEDPPGIVGVIILNAFFAALLIVSAVAVSANLCAVAVGNETWGSIICPSNANGIVGIKPTVGLWSRTGIVPISYTQDTAGPMAGTVKDAAILLGALTGIDSSDQKTLASAGRFYNDYTQFLKTDGLSGKRIGYLNKNKGTHFKVDSLMHRALDDMKARGAIIIELEEIVQGSSYAHAYQVMAYEFKDGLKKYFYRLGEHAPVSDLEEVIKLTRADSIEMQYFDVAVMENALSVESILPIIRGATRDTACKADVLTDRWSSGS
jgi:hypothetical protein